MPNPELPNPYHVRLAISQYGDRFRAELFTEDLGDTDGELLPADWRDRFKSWMDFLERGVPLPPDSSRAVGAQLFDWLLSGANRAKWVEILARMDREPSRPLRLLIDSSTRTGSGSQDRDVDRLHSLPYGLLFDTLRHAFLFRPREGATPLQYVRIVRRTTPRLLNLGRTRRPLRALVAIAEPDGMEFTGSEQASRLFQGYAASPEAYAVSVCTPDGPRPLTELPGDGVARVCRCTRENLESALTGGQYDLLHLMAHGRGSGLVLCAPDGAPVALQAAELGEWCRRRKLQLGFLQICKAARTAGEGVFGGLAQELLNPDGGNLAAVVASPYVLESAQSTEAALRFYQQLARGEPPDRAVRRDLGMENFGWAFLELWVRPSALRDTGTRGAFQFVSPYRGLSTFQERDAEVFFGRAAALVALRGILHQEQEAVVAVVGDSGSGKSSLLQAGLAHSVRSGGLAGRTGWRIVSVEPGTEPARSLMARLLPEGEGQPPDLTPPGHWLERLTAALQASFSETRPLLLIIDQFEELFTLCNEQPQREVVARALAQLAHTAPRHTRIVLGMRCDYVGSAVALPGLGALLQRPWVLRPPGPEEVRAIVVEPAEVYGYRFQGPVPGEDKADAQGLLDEILEDPLLSAGKAGESAPHRRPQNSAPLPLLEFALEQLWAEAVGRGSQEFTHKDYERIGGLSGAIARHADDVYERLPIAFQGRHPDPQRLAEFVFTSVVSTDRTRRPRPRGELEDESGEYAAVTRNLIEHLVGERLLTIRSDPNHLSSSLVDIAHETLITRWGRLREWLDTDVQERQLREDFQRDAENYGKRARRLPAAATQHDYLGWIGRKDPPLTETQRAFAGAMRRSVRLLRWLKIGIVIGLAVVAAWLWFLWNRAETNVARVQAILELRELGLVVKENKSRSEYALETSRDVHGLKQLTDADFSRVCELLARLNNVKRIAILNQQKVTTLRPLARSGCSSVEELNVKGWTALSDVAALRALGTVKKVNLSHTNVTDGSLAGLPLRVNGQRRKMIMLSLKHTPVSDAGLQSLAQQLEAVDHLLLSTRSITAAGLRALSAVEVQRLTLEAPPDGEAGLFLSGELVESLGKIKGLRSVEFIEISWQPGIPLLERRRLSAELAARYQSVGMPDGQ